MAKNTSATPETQENTVPETRVTVQPREVAPHLAWLAKSQESLDAQVKRSDVLRDIATNALGNIDVVTGLLSLASESIAAQTPSDKTICAQEMLAQCYAVVEEYNRTSDHDARTLALDTLRVKYAALATWLSSSGKNVRDSITGESREKSDSEKNALRMARAIGSQATRLVPFHLSDEKRQEVETFKSQRLAKRLARGATVNTTIVPSN